MKNSDENLQIPDAAVQAALLSMARDNIGTDVQGLLVHGFDKLNAKPNALRNALTSALPHMQPVDVAAVRRQALEEAYKRAAEATKKSLEVSEDYAWDEADGIHHLIIGLIDTHPDAIRALSVEPAQAKARYEALICKDIPADCCDYGVISHESGKEVCRVWDEDYARLIADLLNAEPARREQWQPIETAPKDGTVIDLWANPSHVGACRYAGFLWDDGRWCQDGLELYTIDNLDVTHWMPLPAAPTPGGRGMKLTPCPTCQQALPVAIQTIDMDARIIVANGYFASLTEQEFSIFMSLYAANGKMKTKEQLLRAITSFIDEEPEIKVIDVHMHRIRTKTKNLSFQIQTIRNEGYRLLQRGHQHE